MGNFKFGSGENPDADTKERPQRCPKCGGSGNLIIVTGSFGLRQWMCRPCQGKYAAYMMRYYLKSWTYTDNDVMQRQGRCYAYRVHETDAALIAAGGGAR